MAASNLFGAINKAVKALIKSFEAPQKFFILIKLSEMHVAGRVKLKIL